MGGDACDIDNTRRRRRIGPYIDFVANPCCKQVREAPHLGESDVPATLAGDPSCRKTRPVHFYLSRQPPNADPTDMKAGCSLL